MYPKLTNLFFNSPILFYLIFGTDRRLPFLPSHVTILPNRMMMVYMSNPKNVASRNLYVFNNAPEQEDNTRQ